MYFQSLQGNLMRFKKFKVFKSSILNYPVERNVQENLC